MARNGSGTYTLPLADVVDATAITPAWANTTLDDIATELTDSLDRYGRGDMLVALLNTDGTELLPGITFNLEPATGIRRSGADEMRAVVSGSDVARWFDDTGTAAGSQRPFEIWDGSAFFAPTNPSSPPANPTLNAVTSSNGATISGGGLTVDSGAVLLSDGNASFTAEVTVSGGGGVTGGICALPDVFRGASVRGSNGAYQRYTNDVVPDISRTGTGTYLVSFDAVGSWPQTNNAVIAVTPFGTTPLYAQLENTGGNNVRVYIRDYSTNALTDADFATVGILSA